jgi:hypothetical protein
MSSKVEVIAEAIIKQLLTAAFPDSIITPVEYGFKIHVERIITRGLLDLANMATLYQVKVDLKRSGTGITILISY